MKKKVLNKVANGVITPNDAFNLLYGNKPKRGSFIKIQMHIKESLFISNMINVLFFIPMPISFGKYFIKKQLVKYGIPLSLYQDIINNCGGTSVTILNEDVKIKVKIM